MWVGPAPSRGLPVSGVPAPMWGAGDGSPGRPTCAGMTGVRGALTCAEMRAAGVSPPYPGIPPTLVIPQPSSFRNRRHPAAFVIAPPSSFPRRRESIGPGTPKAKTWIPAYAGMTVGVGIPARHPRLRSGTGIQLPNLCAPLHRQNFCASAHVRPSRSFSDKMTSGKSSVGHSIAKVGSFQSRVCSESGW